MKNDKKEVSYNDLAVRELNKIFYPAVFMYILAVITAIYTVVSIDNVLIATILFSTSILEMIIGYILIYKLEQKSKELTGRDWDEWFNSKYSNK